MSANPQDLAAQMDALSHYVQGLSEVPTILVVEDNADDLLLFTKQLRQISERFLITIALSGEDSIEALRRHRFDLIFLDLRMPGMGGIESLKVMKEMRVKAPIVVVSGMDNGPMVNEALKIGALIHLKKPVDLLNLRHILTWTKT